MQTLDPPPASNLLEGNGTVFGGFPEVCPRPWGHQNERLQNNQGGHRTCEKYSSRNFCHHQPWPCKESRAYTLDIPTTLAALNALRAVGTLSTLNTQDVLDTRHALTTLKPEALLHLFGISPLGQVFRALGLGVLGAHGATRCWWWSVPSPSLSFLRLQL